MEIESLAISELQRENSLLKKQVHTLVATVESMTSMKLEAEVEMRKWKIQAEKLTNEMNVALKAIQELRKEIIAFATKELACEP